MQTHTFIERLAKYTTFGKIASKFRTTTKTAEAWGREPESNLNPTGSGKKNPLDGVLRLMGMAFEKDRGLAKEIGDLFPNYFLFLLGQKKGEAACRKLMAGQAVKEHADVIFEILGTDEIDFQKLGKEMAEFDIVWINLKQWARDEQQFTLKAVV